MAASHVAIRSGRAANFKIPPREYGAMHWALWGGELTRERIVQEFDQLVANGMYLVNFGPAQHMNPKYLSQEHIELTKFAVAEAAKRGMKEWLADEGSYPSGFAGGKIGERYPQLTMQGIDADIRICVMPGRTLTIPTLPDTLGAFMVHTQTGTATIVPVIAAQVLWTAPAPPPALQARRGPWGLVFVRHVFRSSPRVISTGPTARQPKTASTREAIRRIDVQLVRTGERGLSDQENAAQLLCRASAAPAHIYKEPPATACRKFRLELIIGPSLCTIS